MEEGVEEQGEVDIGGCLHGGGVVERVQYLRLSHLGEFILIYDFLQIYIFSGRNLITGPDIEQRFGDQREMVGLKSSWFGAASHSGRAPVV